MDMVSKFIGRNITLKQLISKASSQRPTASFCPRLISGGSASDQKQYAREEDEYDEEKRRIEDKESKRGVRDFGEVTKETAEKVSGKEIEGIESKSRRRKMVREIKESAREKAMERTQVPC